MSLGHIVVTGADGFIGRQVCRKLVESNKEVTACIRERADASVFGDISGSLKLCRISSLVDDGNLTIALRNADAVIHLAGRAHVMRETAVDALREYRTVNVSGTESIASVAARSGVRRFIFISSVKVNGEATEGAEFFADDQPNYVDPYGQSKWEAEERLLQIAADTQMEWVVVRPPLVYGPEVRGNFLSLMNCVYRRIPLPLGSLHNRRSLVSVYNLSDFLCLLVDHPGAANNRFLVSDREDVSTPELIRRLGAAFHRSARIARCPEAVLHFAGTLLRKNAAVQRLCSSLVLDREKARRSLGWDAPMSLERGLDRTAEWFLRKKGRE